MRNIDVFIELKLLLNHFISSQYNRFHCWEKWFSRWRFFPLIEIDLSGEEIALSSPAIAIKQLSRIRHN